MRGGGRSQPQSLEEAPFAAAVVRKRVNKTSETGGQAASTAPLTLRTECLMPPTVQEAYSRSAPKGERERPQSKDGA